MHSGRCLLAGLLASLSSVAAAPAQQARMWSASVLAPHHDIVGDEAGCQLEPVAIVGCRNGSFSGKVVVVAPDALGISAAAVSDLKTSDGRRTIPAAAVAVRVATGSLKSGWQVQSKAGSTFDVLQTPPVTNVPPLRNRDQKYHSWVVAGRSYAPVWVTVNVPAGAAAGDYSGLLSVTAGGKAMQAEVRLRVHGWALPKSTEFTTWIETIQSPDSLALQYNVPLWSERHWRLIEQSLRYGALLGNRSVYFPLICETNLGNAESLVRWRRAGADRFTYDTAIVEKYLDMQIGIQGKPKMVIFPLWDIFLEGGAYDAQHESEEVRMARQEHQGRGPEVSLLDADGGLIKQNLPEFSDPAAYDIWSPLLKSLQGLLARRGIADAMTFGIATDRVIHKSVFELVARCVPGPKWVIHAHSYYGGKAKAGDFRYAAFVWGVKGYANGQKGWLNPMLLAQFPRNWQSHYPITSYRLLPEVNITGGQRGAGRLGLDFFDVVRDQRGRAVGQCWARYPKANWRNLNITECLLAPGPEGPLATARFEMLREGVQECEARIYLQSALDGGRLPRELKSRVAAVLAERDAAIRRVGITNAKRPWFNERNIGEEDLDFYAANYRRLSDELYASCAAVAASGVRVAIPKVVETVD